MKNPIQEIRVQRDLSRADLSHHLDSHINMVALVETGGYRALPKTWKSGIEALGLDFNELAEAYRAWRQGSPAGVA